MLIDVFKFQGHEKKKNSGYWLNALIKMDNLGCQRMLRAITGSSAFDVLSNRYEIRVAFFSKGRYQKDMILHACSNSLDVIDC